MMATLYFITHDSVVQVTSTGNEWELKETTIPGKQLQCLAIDPHQPKRLYVGTFDDGLLYSNDQAQTFQPVGSGISHTRVSAVAVSPVEKSGSFGVVWAGTEPSALFRSEDGGQSWQERKALLDLPSRPTWSFPPRPHTHHVRWIEPDCVVPERIYVGIELGGVMRSLDKGLTWQDRKPGSQHDCHTLATHAQAAGRLYEAAGGGYAETLDGGTSWETQNKGLEENHYLVDIAVDQADPNNIIASAARGPRQSYNAQTAESYIIRREAGGQWQRISKGLPEAKGMVISALTSGLKEAGLFYAVNNHGIFRSMDTGLTWNSLPVEWPEHLHEQRIRGVVLAE